MDLAWIRTFLRVAKLRSFTRAADELYLSQPAVSRQIKKLEEELHVILLDRSSGSIILTSEGKRFQEYATQALEDFERINEEMRSSSAQLSGALRIAASTIPGEFLAPELAIQFTKLHPQVEPHITIGDSKIVIEELLSGRFDVGFVGAKLIDREIQYSAVAQDEVVLAVPVSHAFASRNEIELDDLTGQPFIEREVGSGTAISVRRTLNEHGRDLPAYRTVMRLSSTDAVLSAVERGHGIGWVSSFALKHRNPESVAAVRMIGIAMHRALYLATNSNRSLPAVAASFVKWIKKTQSPDWSEIEARARSLDWSHE